MTCTPKSGERKIARFKFNSHEFEINEEAYMNENTSEYLLDGKTEDKQIVKKLFNDWDTTTVAVEWTEVK